MTTLPNLTELADLSDSDWVYVWDASNPGTPDRKASPVRFRPPGARITNHLRYEANITIPAMAAGDEATATIAVAGAIPGDHVVFNLAAAPPANIGIMACWAELDVVKVRFRNTHASVAYVSAAVACTALVSRSAAP